MTMSAIFGAHAPLIRDYPSAPQTPPAPPAPPTPPQPPASQPIAFSAVTRDSLFLTIGSAIGTPVTLATITCADASMTIAVSESVAGLTFSYTSNVLKVSGTPTGSTRVQRIVVSYVASDGTSSTRGSTTHELTLVKNTDLLTIGSMASAAGRVGVPLSATLASPTTNYACDVTSAQASVVPGLAATLAWTRGASSGLGTLTLSGTPTQAGTYSLAVTYSANGQALGLSTHTVVVAASYEAPSPAPAPAPAPPAPSPTAPPTPPSVDEMGFGPDPLLSSVKVLMGFDYLAASSYDPTVGPTYVDVNVRGAYATMRNVVTSTDGGAMLGQINTKGRGGTGIYSAAAVLQSGSSLTTAVAPTASSTALAGVDGADGALCVECFAYLSAATWTALTASGQDARLYPLVSLVDATGALVWALGYGSWMTVMAGVTTRVVAPVHIVALNGARSGGTASALVAAGPLVTANPDRFVHIAASRKVSGSNVLVSVWHDGQAGAATETDTTANLKACTTGELRIGQGCPRMATDNGIFMPLSGVAQIDELRITAASRYGSYVTSPPSNFPTWGTRLPSWANRAIPWPNY